MSACVRAFVGFLPTRRYWACVVFVCACTLALSRHIPLDIAAEKGNKEARI